MNAGFARDVLKPLTGKLSILLFSMALILTLQYPQPLTESDMPKGLERLSPHKQGQLPKLRYSQIDSPTTSAKRYAAIVDMKANSSMPAPEGTITAEGHAARQSIRAEHERVSNLNSDKVNMKDVMTRQGKEELKEAYFEEISRMKGRLTEAEYTELRQAVSKAISRAGDTKKAARAAEIAMSRFGLDKAPAESMSIRKANVVITRHAGGRVVGVAFNDRSQAPFDLPEEGLPGLVATELVRFDLAHSGLFKALYGFMIAVTVLVYVLYRLLSSRYPEESHGSETADAGQFEEYKRTLEAMKEARRKPASTGSESKGTTVNQGWNRVSPLSGYIGYAVVILLVAAFAGGWALYTHPGMNEGNEKITSMLTWEE